jgi:hypothetical protein
MEVWQHSYILRFEICDLYGGEFLDHDIVLSVKTIIYKTVQCHNPEGHK